MIGSYLIHHPYPQRELPVSTIPGMWVASPAEEACAELLQIASGGFWRGELGQEYQVPFNYRGRNGSDRTIFVDFLWKGALIDYHRLDDPDFSYQSRLERISAELPNKSVKYKQIGSVDQLVTEVIIPTIGAARLRELFLRDAYIGCAVPKSEKELRTVIAQWFENKIGDRWKDKVFREGRVGKVG